MRAPRGKAAGGKAKWGPLGLGCGETAQGISASAAGHVAGHSHPASEPRASYVGWLRSGVS